MNEQMYLYYFVTFFSFIPFISLASVSSPICKGKHLGELCDYRRICLDENSECVGQIKHDSFFGKKEKLLKYKCQCKRFYEVDDGKCIFNKTIMTVLIVAIITISILLLIPIIMMVMIIKKTDPVFVV